MYSVRILLTDGRSLVCPRIVSGQHLTAELKVPSVTLGKATPLKNGDVLRGFQYVGSDQKLHDLGNFDDLFLSNRSWFGRIERP